jgi:hypothetical protein
VRGERERATRPNQLNRELVRMIFGYLDPGSGSVILQALVGGFAAVAVTAKLWWKRVTGIFRRNRDEDAAPATPEESA